MLINSHSQGDPVPRTLEFAFPRQRRRTNIGPFHSSNASLTYIQKILLEGVETHSVRSGGVLKITIWWVYSTGRLFSMLIDNFFVGGCDWLEVSYPGDLHLKNERHLQFQVGTCWGRRWQRRLNVCQGEPISQVLCAS